jgi:hypothetical protein
MMAGYPRLWPNVPVKSHPGQIQPHLVYHKGSKGLAQVPSSAVKRERVKNSLRNGFTAYFALFPENGSFASVACASYRKLSASTAAPEPRDFTVRIKRVRLARFLRPPHPTARS